MEAGVVLPLGPLDTDMAHRHSWAPDAVVSVLYHSGGNNTPYIPVCPGVWSTPLGGETAGQALQRGLCFCDQKAVNLDV